MKNYIDNSYLNEFGKNLRRLRKRENLTQEKLAFKIGVEISQISRIERGVISTTISTAKLIADGLDISVSTLFDF